MSTADRAGIYREARRRLAAGAPAGGGPRRPFEAEGGCGVVGLASSVPLEGRYLLASLAQMKNRGNEKGGGVAMVGLVADQLGVDPGMLERETLLQVAYLEPQTREAVEAAHVRPAYEVLHQRLFRPRAEGLAVPPPEVWAYWVRPRPEVLAAFVRERGLEGLSPEEAADELVYQTSFGLNQACYASLGEKKAFVLSHGRNLLVFKLVGYADDVVRAYDLADLAAHVWIGHHRYPTKGRVWHPGGAHPFVGLHEALVHNGDFANYYSITQVLRQHHIVPLYLTDTEVAALAFDHLRRARGYSLEQVIEALAPTTERDFERLPLERQRIYRRLRQIHVHSSPDGPWFFIVAANPRGGKGYELVGITDTSMLRPQVFALQRGRLDVGLVASEKQAIDAVLRELYRDGRVHAPYADRLWNARGGSYTDGGAFVFTVNGGLACANKFGQPVDVPPVRAPSREAELVRRIAELEDRGDAAGLTRLVDSRREAWGVKSSLVRTRAEEAVYRLFDRSPRRLTWESRARLAELPPGELQVDATGFPPEGDDSLARFLVEAHRRGFRGLVGYRLAGQRFLGCGLGPGSAEFRLDVYGSPGDYLASGLDGGTVAVHAAGQDQLGNILKAGRLVVHGDVGQCFLYGAKGGEVYVLGNAAGRPAIAAVGSPRVVLNGTALDYLAESFMAGDPTNGGGFVVVNGLAISADGELVELETPYPGGNLFSLASGGAVYVRDPRGKLTADQLNGGEYAPLEEADWRAVRPALEENERWFGIRLEELLAVDGRARAPAEVYRKVTVRRGNRH